MVAVLNRTNVLSRTNVLPYLGGKLSALARRHGVPGAQVAIHHAGETVATEIGELRYRSGQRVTRETAFPIGSISKSFTATLAMTLVADGDVDLDGPLDGYLPELGSFGAQLTLRQVLSHTAGFASGPDSEDVAGATVRRYVQDHCRRDNLVLPPGTGFSYSNMGYVLVGRLIETITGMNWRDAIESILLRPLGIAPAFIHDALIHDAINRDPAAPSGRPIATGHSVNAVGGRTRPVRQSLSDAEAPAGALAASAVDLVTLGLMHLEPGVPELLPAEHAEQMRHAVAEAEPFGLADGWGLGLALFRGTDTADAAEWAGHDGNGDGTSCYLRINRQHGWVVALTSNANTGVGLWNELLAELARLDAPIGPPRAWASPARSATPPRGCVGTYANGSLEYVVTGRQDGHLYLAIDGADPTRMTCHDGLTFTLRDPSSGQQVFGGRFLRDTGSGRVEAIQLGGRLARRRMQSTFDTRQELTA